MVCLPDINVLIARSDPKHEWHERVKHWFTSVRPKMILLCPLTENGFIRIFGHPNYPNGPGSVMAASADLRVIRALPQVEFIPDSVSVIDPRLISQEVAIGPRQLTDIYLLALATTRGARFVTLDDRVPANIVVGGEQALLVID